MAAKRLTDKQRKQIIADRVNGLSFRQIAAKYGVSTKTVQRTIQNQPQVLQKATEKKEQNTLDMLSYMDTQKGKAQELLNNIILALNNPEKLAKANVRDLATAYGIIADKYIQLMPKDNAEAFAKLDELIEGINHEAEQ